jgi:nucleoside-diphosphate-sugar epimerase
MRVLITGVTGFLGSSLASHLSALGHEVRGTSTGAANPSRRAEGGSTFQHRLGQPVDEAMFTGVDAAVHAAHDLSPGSRRTNVAGTIALAEAARSRGVTRQIFISSYSAHPLAVSEYGETKGELQAWFLAAGLTVAQPGLVIGRGGLYARIAEVVKTRRVVPVVSPGALVPVIALGDFNQSLAALIESPKAGLVRLYLDERVTMLRLMREIRRSVGSRAVLVPVPFAIGLWGVALLETVRLRPPFTRDNLEGLRANQGRASLGDLSTYVRSPKGLVEMTDAAR